MNLWHISEDTFDPTARHLHSQETVYTIGNGYFCTRGTFEEGYPGENPATLLFGVFDNVPIAREELANTPDWLPIKLFVNGERFRLDRGHILDYQRTLNMQNGVLHRTVYWESPTGIRLHVTSERFASLTNEHTSAIRYSVTADGGTADKNLDIQLYASFNTAVGNYDLMHWDTLDQGHQGEIIWLQSQTKKSGVQLAQTMSFTTDAQNFQTEILDSDIAPGIRLYGTLAAGATITTEKVVVMYTSRDGVEPTPIALEQHQKIVEANQDVQRLQEPDRYHALSQGTAAPATAEPRAPQVRTNAYSRLLAQDEEAWQQFWQGADVVIEGDSKAQLGIRYNIYQLRINASLHDDRYSIAAKGLTGFGYRGHIFHDTEVFMLPFYIYEMPDVARNLLLYRYHTLAAAREKAASGGFKGAQFAWESTLSGKETTPPTIVHPETGEVIPVLNGPLELHITSSISHAMWQYWSITGDDEFMRDYGAEVVLSASQFWVSRVQKNTERNDYELLDVIGPDEWHEHVNNNAFTNYMVRWNIQLGLDTFKWLSANYPAKAQALQQRLGLAEQDLNQWRTVVSYMRIPQDKQSGLFEQFDGFFQLEPLDQEKYKGRNDSYQGIIGVGSLQKYRIIKQADVLMLLTMLDQDFDLKTKKANWDYYYPITDHDYGSSLTPAFHVVLATELGRTKEAYELFMKGALVDLENLRGNTPEGIHTACSGAVWQAAIFGFAGLSVTPDGYTTNPHWPNNWTRLAFNFMHKGKMTHVDLHRS